MSDSIAELCIEGIKQATNKGYEVLIGPEASVCQAVETAVHYLETDPVFFQGSYFCSVVIEFTVTHPLLLLVTGMIGTSYHDIHMDAMLMEGRKLRAGCILGVRNISNPIRIAHHLLEKVMLILMLSF